MRRIADKNDCRRVRVVRINSRLNVGGIARHITWLTAGLVEHGFDTTLITGSVSPGEEDMAAFAASQGVNPLLLSEMGREIVLRDLVTVWKLYRLLVHLRPAIVHTHASKAGAVGRIAGLLYRWLTPGTLWGRPRACRLVHTFHGHIFHSYYGLWKTRLFLGIERLLARWATDRIVVISPQQRKEIHEAFGVGRASQFAVIPLGLDLDMFRDWPGRRPVLRRELSAAPEEVLVGIVGRLTEIKNHHLFLQMVVRYKEFTPTGPRVRFVVIGNGHLRGTLEKACHELGLDQDIQFLGHRDDPENFYPGLDVVALTSRNEGTPLSLIEAMANGRPVLATAVGGVVDLLGPAMEGTVAVDAFKICAHGVATGSEDSVALAHGLRRLVLDESLRRRMGEQAQAFVQNHYAQSRLLADIAGLYQELLKPEGQVATQNGEASAPHSQNACVGG